MNEPGAIVEIEGPATPITEARMADFKQRWQAAQLAEPGTRYVIHNPWQRKNRISILSLAAGTALGIGIATLLYTTLGWITVAFR